MDQTDQYWTKIDEGCIRAVEELGNVAYKWYAPEIKDSARQIEVINNAVADGAQVILLTAVSNDALNDTLTEISEAGVKIVYLDSEASFSPVIATYATDNYAAGQLAGESMLRLLSEQGITEGKIGIIGVDKTVPSATMREAGIRDAISGSRFEILETQYCEGDFSRSKDAASGLIIDECVGLFGTNEGSTVGVGNAVREFNRQVIGIGFDNSDNIMELLEVGALQTVIAQQPDEMGYQGIQAAVRYLEGNGNVDQQIYVDVEILETEVKSQ